MKNKEVHQYETCTSTGPQHLNPDPERSGLSRFSLLAFAFGLGFIKETKVVMHDLEVLLDKIESQLNDMEAQ